MGGLTFLKLMDGARKIFKRILTAAIITFLMTGAGVTFAEEAHHRAKRLKDAGDILPLEKILEKAKRRYPGRVLETELEERKGRFIYELEILDQDGVVQELRFDARTGKLLEMEEEK